MCFYHLLSNEYLIVIYQLENKSLIYYHSYNSCDVKVIKKPRVLLSYNLIECIVKILF